MTCTTLTGAALDPFEWLRQRVAECGITLERTDRITSRSAIDHDNGTLWVRNGLSWATHRWTVARGVDELLFPGLAKVAYEDARAPIRTDVHANVIPLLRRPW